MKSKAVLTAADVQVILDGARQYALEHGHAVSISVVDDGGYLLGLVRLDGAAPMSAMVAPGKAHAAAIGRTESGKFESSINGGRYAFLSVPVPTLLEGGVPIVVDGEVIGAVGVSGVKSSQDVEIGRAGIAALLGG